MVLQLSLNYPETQTNMDDFTLNSSIIDTLFKLQTY